MKKFILALLITTLACSFVGCGPEDEYEQYKDKQEIKGIAFFGANMNDRRIINKANIENNPLMKCRFYYKTVCLSYSSQG